jgi:predicted metal-binding protein
MPSPYDGLINEAKDLGAMDAGLLDSKKLAFDPRSFLKCRFGCGRWGKFWTCHPHINISPEQFKESLDRYSTALIIKSPDAAISQKITLQLEKRAMLHYGATFAFGLVLCVECDECAYPDPCRFPHLARPAMDAMGIDIPKTVEQLGYSVDFDPNGTVLPGWYSMVLLD